MATLLLYSSVAYAQIPGDTIPAEATRPDGIGAADAPGDVQAGGGEGRAARQPQRRSKDRVVRKCVTRKATRTCRSYRGLRITKVCVTRPHRKTRCRRIRASAATRVNGGWESSIGPAIGRSYYHNPENTVPYDGWCSGAFIANGLFLTAAHCLYSNGNDGGAPHAYPATQMNVVPGNSIDSQGRPASDYGTWSVVENYVPTGWQTGDNGLDWGIQVIAPDARGNYPGSYTGTYRWYAGLSLNPGNVIYADGYPASGLFRTSKYYYGAAQYFVDSRFNGTGWWDYGTAANRLSSGTWVYYDSEMTGGSSGGPVFTQFADGSYGIFGVVNRGRPTAATGEYVSQYQLSVMFDSRFVEFYNSVVNAASGARRAQLSTQQDSSAVAVGRR